MIYSAAITVMSTWWILIWVNTIYRKYTVKFSLGQCTQNIYNTTDVATYTTLYFPLLVITSDLLHNIHSMFCIHSHTKRSNTIPAPIDFRAIQLHHVEPQCCSRLTGMCTLHIVAVSCSVSLWHWSILLVSCTLVNWTRINNATNNLSHWTDHRPRSKYNIKVMIPI